MAAALNSTTTSPLSTVLHEKQYAALSVAPHSLGDPRSPNTSIRSTSDSILIRTNCLSESGRTAATYIMLDRPHRDILRLASTSRCRALAINYVVVDVRSRLTHSRCLLAIICVTLHDARTTW